MVAVFVFDAVSVPLVERMLAQGRLPVLAQLRARGRWQLIDSDATYFGDRETAHTGVEVSEHGQTFPFQWSSSEQRLRFFRSFPTSESIWERVARSGGRSLVIDPYESRPPTRPVGTIVSGWQYAHSAVLQRWGSPSQSYRAFSRRYGRSPEVEDVYGRPSVRGLQILRQQLLAAPGRVARLATDLLSRERYDLVWLELSSGHLAGHHFWNLRQLTDTALDDGLRTTLEATIADSYAAMDAALGEILTLLPDASDVLVFSEVGMAASRARTDLLPEMLARVLANDRAGGDSAAGKSLWRVRTSVPARARMTATRLLPDPVVHALSAFLYLRGVDWRRTRAFALPGDHDGYVRLNVRGRERDGIVAPEDADALVDEITTGLASFADPDGTPCVAGVDRVSDLVGTGPRSDQLPDLIIRWADISMIPLPGVTSPRYGDVLRRGLGIGRSGNHVDGSWLLTVPGTTSSEEPGRPPRLVDVAATVCRLTGADPDGLVGEPLVGFS